MLADDRLGAEVIARGLGDDIELALVVAAEMVDGDDDRQAELAHIGDMAAKIGEARLHRRMVLFAKIGLGDATLGLQRTQGRDDDRSGWRKSGLAAFDVEEFLRAEIGAEARFGDGVIRERQAPRSSRSPNCSHARYWRRDRHG